MCVCVCEFSGEAYESHEGVCPQENVYYESKCGDRMMRRLLVQHVISECPKCVQPCVYCTKELIRATSTNTHACLFPAPTNVE